MSVLSIRRINKDELIYVHQLANEIWPLTFEKILSKDQIAFMLNWMYSIESLNTQMDNDCTFLLASNDDLKVGYASFQLNYKKGICRLHKLYIHPDLHRQGIGKELIKRISEVCIDHENSQIELNVNRFNKAVAFYIKLGFTIFDEEDIDIGKGFLMEDYIMNLTISQA